MLSTFFGASFPVRSILFDAPSNNEDDSFIFVVKVVILCRSSLGNPFPSSPSS
nr:MAG TPA: hypothetical protein [Caudoviricetes sp.]